MHTSRRRRGVLLWGVAGLAAGLLAGAALLALTGAAGANRVARRSTDQPRFIAATHLPPLLTVPGEPAELRYDIYCDDGVGSEDTSCDAGGTVFVRAGSSGVFRALALSPDAAAQEGRYVARVPFDVASSALGYQYYAVIRDSSTGQTTTLPSGGAAAPQWSRSLVRPAIVGLGTHEFGAIERPDARVVSAAWGSGPGQVGLEGGLQSTPVGGSSFDVDVAGTVTVLDEVNRRVLRFAAGAPPVAVPLDISGREADMSLEADGTIDVLEPAAAGQPAPLLRTFDPSGRALGVAALPDPVAAQVRIGPAGPTVLQYPSAQWQSGRQSTSIADRWDPDQPGAARAGRPLPGGGEVVVMRKGGEIRVALVSSGIIQRSWRVQSDTSLAEVQLAQPLGDRLVLIVRAYTDSADQFVALVLDGRGLVRSFSLDSADWAESAPLSRFRLVGQSLYRLGSGPEGLFVDRYDLEVS